MEIVEGDRDVAPYGTSTFGSRSIAIGAPAAQVGAVLDALGPIGVDTLEMPLTPERVWRAINAASPSSAPSP